MITVSINNESNHLAETMDLHSAMVHWGYGEKKCAVAINGEFIPRSQYAVTAITDGDEIDVVAAVGGG